MRAAALFSLKLFVSALSSLCALELLTRVFLPPPRSVYTASYAPPSEVDLTGPVTLRANVGLYLQTESGLRLRPNAVAHVYNDSISGKEIIVRTNQFGFRGPTMSAKTRKRIVVLGDSITLGAYLPEHETYPALLETAIRGEHGLDFDVINAGVGATGTSEQLALLVEQGLQAQPDLVLLGLYLNDYRTNEFIRYPTIGYPFSSSHFILHAIDLVALSRFRMRYGEKDSGLSPHALEDRLRSELHNESENVTRGFELEVFAAKQDWGGSWLKESTDEIMRGVVQMAQVLKDRKISFAVTIFPVKAQIISPQIYDMPQRRLSEALRRESIPHLDLLPLLRAAFEDGRAAGLSIEDLMFDHCHLTERGNSLVANSLGRFMFEKVLSTTHLEPEVDERK